MEYGAEICNLMQNSDQSYNQHKWIFWEDQQDVFEITKLKIN